MKELNAKIEQTGKREWQGRVGALDDLDNAYAIERGRVKVFIGKTEQAVLKKVNAYANEEAVKQARIEAAYIVPLTAGLLETAEKKEPHKRVEELQYKAKKEKLTPEEFRELQQLVN